MYARQCNDWSLDDKLQVNDLELGLQGRIKGRGLISRSWVWGGGGGGGGGYNKIITMNSSTTFSGVIA